MTVTEGGVGGEKGNSIEEENVSEARGEGSAQREVRFHVRDEGGLYDDDVSGARGLYFGTRARYSQ